MVDEMIVLDGGLDLQKAKLAVEKGYLIDGLNYEVIDRQGYKRIDGFDRFDGRSVPGSTTVTTGRLTGRSTGLVFPSPMLAAGQAIRITSNPLPFGVVNSFTYEVNEGLGAIDWDITYAVVPDSYTVTSSHVVLIIGDTLGTGIDVSAVFSSSTSPATLETANALAAVVRSNIQDLRNRPIGLHLFRDKLYAIADEDVLYYDSGSSEFYVGDILEDPSGNEALVIDVGPITSGSIGAGTAAGTLLIHRIDSGALFTTDTITIARPGAGAVADAGTVTAGSGVEPWRAGIWRGYSAEQATELGGTPGWNKANTGVSVEFEDGFYVDGEFPKIDRLTNQPNVEYGTDSTSVAGTDGIARTGVAGFIIAGDPTISAGAIAAALEPPTIIYSTNSDDLVSVAAAEEAPTLNALTFYASGPDGGFEKITPRVGLTNFNTVSGIPGFAVIRGVEVYLDNVSGDTEASAGNLYNEISLDVALMLHDDVNPIKLGTSKFTSVTNINGGATGTVDVVMGGATDLWGAASIPLNSVVNAKFGVTIKANINVIAGADSVGGTAQAQALIDRVRVKVYYEKLFTRYYFWNDVDADDVQADLIDYRIFEGDILLGTSEGVMQFVNIEPTGAAERRSIRAGDEIHLAPGGADATRVGTVVSVGPNAPASLSSLLEADSRYQFVTANFFANDDYDAFYGVSGASRAFSYDGNYFITIYAVKSNEEEKDKPRHVAHHFGHLALGYRSGSVLFSQLGNPEEFPNEVDALEGEDLGSEIAVGDRITGLLPLSGTVLGVFCENSIYGISGTSRDNFAPQTLAPATGAIEYTVVDGGGQPMFCDARGICTLAQSEKYGNFAGSRLSANITSYLLPHLRRVKNTLSSATETGVRCMIPARASNQVLLFLQSGRVICMTMVGMEGQPQFTFREYYIGQDDTNETGKYLVPIAWSAQADHEGTERIHVAHYSTSSEVSESSSKYVYELNTGWSFAGNFIPAYFVTSWQYAQPSNNWKLTKLILDGVSFGQGSLRLTTARDLLPTFQTTAENVSMPKTPAATLSTDYTPYFTVASPHDRGRTISMKFTAHETDITVPEPPHICQVLVLGLQPDLSKIV
jgi:hypothetical protein